MSVLHEAALDLARRGLHVLPIEPNGKAPIGSLVPHGAINATRDPRQIDRWWSARPEANIGGRVGDGIAVLDVDNRHGGFDTLRALVSQFGALPDTSREAW